MAKYPNVKVRMVGEDKNAYSILSRVRRAMMAAKIPNDEIVTMIKEATGGDYNHLLKTVMEWVGVI